MLMKMNKLILGTVQMGLDYGINNSNGQISLADSFQILKTAHEAGVRYLDSAEAYGSAHRVIGQYHQAFPDHKFEVVTKLPHVINEDISDKIEHYLEDLHVENLHALLFHSYTSYRENETQLKKLVHFKNQGLVKKFGVSVYTNEEIEVAINDDEIDIIQFPYNLLDNYNLRGEVLNKAKAKGKLIQTRSCFLQGLFFLPLNSTNKIAGLLHKELTALESIAGTTGTPMQQMALNYCLQEELIDYVLIGVDNLAQLDGNIKYVNNSIVSSTIQEINKIKVQDLRLLNPSLWTAL